MADEKKELTRTSWSVNKEKLIANFPDGDTLELDTSLIEGETREMCFFYGVKQKVADSGAGKDGWPAKRGAMQNTFEMLASGKWSDKKFRRTNEEIIADKVSSAVSGDKMSKKDAAQLKALLAKAGMEINVD